MLAGKAAAFRASVLHWWRTREKSAIEKRIDKFIGKNEARGIVLYSLIGAVAACIVIGIFVACKPSIDNSRARTLAKRGSTDEAMRIVRELAADEYPAEKLTETKWIVTDALIRYGKYQEAASMLEELPAGAKAEEKRQSIKYNEAISFYEQGRYSAAAQVFYQMNDYENSAGYYADCRCALAIQAYLEGNETSAYSLLLDVPDVVERIKTAAYAVAQDDGQAQQILSAEIFQAERLNAMEATMEGLNAARSDMPEGKIAAGARHTLGLSANGTVYAAGDNSYGQLDVGQWSSVKQVAAGAYHSVALLSNGTVAAAGDNSQGQCDVSAWTDIVAIATSAYDTIGLKSDGSVVACGMHAQLVSGWRDVTHITGGSYSMGCIYNKGAMLASHGSAQMDMGVSLYDLAVCGPVSAGVLYDGTLISTYEKAPEWSGLVSVAASDTCLLGIDVDGQVKSYFYRAGDAVDIAVSGKAVEVKSGGTHHVVLTEDGRVECFGENDYGQCNTSGWSL